MYSPVQVLKATDLSMKARIRQAAITRFARDGFDASLRVIAGDAGVSAASIVKHYGSKEELRAACDEQVFAVIRDGKRAVVTAKNGATGAFLGQLARVAEMRPFLVYVLRTYQGGGAAARSFVDHMVADAREYVREGVEAGLIVPSRDEEARARYLIGASLGNLLLEFLFASSNDAWQSDAFWEHAFARIGLPGLELYTEGLLTDRSLLDAYLLHTSSPAGESGGPDGPTDSRSSGDPKGPS